MPAIDLIMEGDGAFKAEAGLITEADPNASIKIALLDGGMTSGRPSVGILVTLPNGSKVLAQTSLRLFCSAAKAFEARHRNLYDGA